MEEIGSVQIFCDSFWLEFEELKKMGANAQKQLPDRLLLDDVV